MVVFQLTVSYSPKIIMTFYFTPSSLSINTLISLVKCLEVTISDDSVSSWPLFYIFMAVEYLVDFVFPSHGYIDFVTVFY